MTAKFSPEVVIGEARALYEQAKKYRAEMEALPADDPRREVYERMIIDLLDRSKKLSQEVKTFVKSAS
jgi:hypothetical protein